MSQWDITILFFTQIVQAYFFHCSQIYGFVVNDVICIPNSFINGVLDQLAIWYVSLTSRYDFEASMW